jgi:chemotaxis protein MotA
MKRHAANVMRASLLLLGCWFVLKLDPAGRVLNLPGLFIVIVGTLAATVLGQSWRSVWNLLAGLPRKLGAVSPANEVDMALFVKVAEMHRQGNIRYAELGARRMETPLLRSGALLVLDRTAHEDVERMLQWKIGAQRQADQSEIQVFRTMMAFAPAFGMIGTLFGLIQMLYGLDAKSLQHIGESMGFAMLTTVYGLLLANLALKPIVTRLERRSHERLAWLYVQCEAVLMLHEQCHPKLIEEYLNAFLLHPGQPDPRGDIELSAARVSS